MKVKELIEALKEMPQEEDVIMFDGPARCMSASVRI